jgi:hypothetical protein
VLTDEEISKLDFVPEVFPDFFLGRSRHVNEVATDLDMRTVYNRQFGPDLPDQRDEAGHLRVVF